MRSFWGLGGMDVFKEGLIAPDNLVLSQLNAKDKD